ncbi:cell division protein ZipA, partial [Oleiagrimonas sp.]|uniref:cell division protein ZipA n=1 Tax=Oleiagrimonas sp. TaxID=2010330 RepID=UPI0026196531
RAPTQVSSLGQRPEGLAVDRIIAINVVAPEDRWFQGSDLIVAADKAGLEFGHKGIFHRMLDGKREMGPLFSVANMLQPGSFDLSQVVELSTTGLSFFMTLPGPVSALDAWEAMLPTAQRMAELLGGEVLDDEHNALGRQRIAHIRDNLRAWDRRHLGGEVGFDSR